MPTSSINRSLYANLTPLPSQSSVTRRPQPGTTKEHHQRRRKRTTPHSNHPATFERLGSTRVKLAGRVADYCRDRPDLADVLAIVEPLLSPTEAEAEDEDDTGDPVGFGSVYMLKAGRDYKIGRTNGTACGVREAWLLGYTDKHFCIWERATGSVLASFSRTE